MIISLRKKFIFVANIKVGSTSIERVLSSHAEISIPQVQFGKHMTLREIYNRFRWIFRRIPRNEFLYFAPCGIQLTV
jgi:hypothetical protein